LFYRAPRINSDISPYQDRHFSAEVFFELPHSGVFFAVSEIFELLQILTAFETKTFLSIRTADAQTSRNLVFL
jgi:hypothetical protein